MDDRFDWDVVVIGQGTETDIPKTEIDQLLAM